MLSEEVEADDEVEDSVVPLFTLVSAQETNAKQRMTASRPAKSLFIIMFFPFFSKRIVGFKRISIK